MKNLLIVGLGGFLGSASRYSIYLLLNKYVQDKLFLSTMLINLLGSFLIGYLGGNGIKAHPVLGLLLITGFCGGFTTFSTFSAENLKLLREGFYLHFSIYLVASVVGGILMCLLGFYLANKS